MTSIETCSEVTDAYADFKSFLSLLTNVASNTDRFYLVDRNIHGTCASIYYMKKQKHTKHTLMVYF
jgi:hypothetical protein